LVGNNLLPLPSFSRFHDFHLFSSPSYFCLKKKFKVSCHEGYS
jgi:hypothetical protein